MSLVINTNVASMTAQRHLASHDVARNRSMEKLASGHRINRASDDAAGLQLSENLRSQIRGSQKALENVQDAINFLNVAEGAIGEIQEAMQRVRELWIQAKNDTYNAVQREAMRQEVAQLFLHVDQIAESTQFNGIHMWDDDADFAINYPPPLGFRIQVSPNADDPLIPVVNWQNSINLNVNSMMLGDIDSNSLFNGYIESPQWFPFMGNVAEIQQFENFLFGQAGNPAIPGVMNIINSHRGAIGAMTNRLEGMANNLQLNIENLSASESRIRDTDIAAETAILAREDILRQAATSMLTQANNAPQLALELLKNSAIR